ncbi:hypothetical protein FOE78_14060 [Microlunatus elymi]|uniref:Uncharacterized protein n=1 Tax=Microlunatus elymi TaxID=2596828 RepID=A0A516Q105_9ACTN|nr:hypothetical protein [Microlunatus elymi]QDP96891.1 hypothetical protein FOE78_14060 [Microlunatus elymi]
MATASAALLVLAVSAPAALAAGDHPSGFWYGTDSSTVKVSGSAPYQEPVIGGSYGGYIGMVGNWANLTGCHKIVVWSSTNAKQANTDYLTYHRGVGVGGYYFMGGPGVDPHYNGTASEAKSWGEKQAAQTLHDLSLHHITYPVAFMDIEIPGDSPSYTPAPDNGWNTVYTSPCSGRVRSHGVAYAVDRAEVNGYADYLTGHSHDKAGVYSAPDIWRSIFGTGTDSLIPNTYEWTYESFTRSLAHRPNGWCLSGTSTCAHFFGGQTSGSKYALMWQWSGGGGSRNGYGDFDQIDGLR